jgi:hypothetical protein
MYLDPITIYADVISGALDPDSYLVELAFSEQHHRKLQRNDRDQIKHTLQQ